MRENKISRVIFLLQFELSAEFSPRIKHTYTNTHVQSNVCERHTYLLELSKMCLHTGTHTDTERCTNNS